MRILVLSSSPRKEKSQTFLLAKEVLKGCSSSDDIKSEVFHLSDLKIEFCRHCEICHKKILSCSIEDDVQMIMKKMLEADGIILSSPNYIGHITASMKALFDRSTHFIHCMRLLNKYVVGVVSSGSGQGQEVLDYIKYYAHICGAQYSGGVLSGTPVNEVKMDEAFKSGEKLIVDIKEKKIFPEQIAVAEEFKRYFKSIMLLRKDDWVEEYQYWSEKGWI